LCRYRPVTPPIFPKVRKAEDMLRETLKSVAKAGAVQVEMQLTLSSS
jgi:hypothetical protein